MSVLAWPTTNRYTALSAGGDTPASDNAVAINERPDDGRGDNTDHSKCWY